MPSLVKAIKRQFGSEAEVHYVGSGTVYVYPDWPQAIREDEIKLEDGELGAIERDILRFVKRRPKTGATCEEIERTLYIKHQTASARIYDLREFGLLKDSGKKRKNWSGRKATVWVAA